MYSILYFHQIEKTPHRKYLLHLRTRSCVRQGIEMLINEVKIKCVEYTLYIRITEDLKYCKQLRDAVNYKALYMLQAK